MGWVKEEADQAEGIIAKPAIQTKSGRKAMTHHINAIWAILGALMLICGAGLWFETWGRHWKQTEMLRSAGFTLLGACYVLSSLNLGRVPDVISIMFGVMAACVFVTLAVLIFKNKIAAGRANAMAHPASRSSGNPNALNQSASELSGPQFRGYRTKPRM